MSHNVGHKIVFRHGVSGTHLRLTVGISLGFFLAMCSLAAFKGGSWVPIAVFSGVALCLFLWLAYLKLEIGESGITYRDFQGNHAYAFAQIEKACFETLRISDGWAPVFSIQLRDSVEKRKIPLLMFPIRASALLFAVFEKQGIPIGLDGSRLVESTMRQIREEQSKFSLCKQIDT